MFGFLLGIGIGQGISDFNYERIEKNRIWAYKKF
jgi:hypothetical protein